MKSIFERTQMLLGASTLNMLKKKKVIVFGVGGVGGFAVEALVRAGIHTVAIVDFDIVDITNINRQIIALHSTIGRKKVEVMEERIRDINPEAEVRAYTERLTEENLESFHLSEYDYIVDAIDDVPAKLLLIREANEKSIPILSSMGTGNKFDPSLFRIDDIKVLFSTEIPHREELPEDGSRSPSSISFVPSTAGLLIAAEVVRDFLFTAPTERAIFGFKIGPKKIKTDY